MTPTRWVCTTLRGRESFLYFPEVCANWEDGPIEGYRYLCFFHYCYNSRWPRKADWGAPCARLWACGLSLLGGQVMEPGIVTRTHMGHAGCSHSDMCEPPQRASQGDKWFLCTHPLSPTVPSLLSDQKEGCISVPELGPGGFRPGGTHGSFPSSHAWSWTWTDLEPAFFASIKTWP